MTETDQWVQARRRLKVKQDFGWHLVTYVVVNGLLVFVWGVNGGGFWPVWVMVPWGIGVVLHAWYAFVAHPITEEDVRRELGRGRRGRRRAGHASS